MTAALFLSLALFSVTLLSVSSTQYPVRYDGYQVIRLRSNHSNPHKVRSELAYVHHIAEKYLLDVWATNQPEGWVDIMVPSSFANALNSQFVGFSYEVRIEDVQRDIEQNEALREQSRSLDFFSDYQAYGNINDWLNEQASISPSKAKKISIGSTYQGLPIHALHLGEDGTNKPTIVIHGGIHAREWISPSTACWIIDQLLNKDPVGDSLLNSFEIIVIPVLNADGYSYTHTTSRLWRKNRQPNSGSTCIGTDINRNFDYDWGGTGASGSPCSDIYYGSAPYSAPEARAVTTLLNSIDNVVAYIDIHSYGALWMSPWGYNCNAYPPEYDIMETFMSASATAVRAVNGRSYTFGAGCQTIYKTSGDCCDDSYGNVGIIHSYTIEAFGNSFTPSPSEIPRVGSEIYAGFRQTARMLQNQKQPKYVS